MERDPAAVLQAAIRGVVDRLPETVTQGGGEVVDFKPAPAFAGPTQGYYFSTGPKGLGYYADPLAPKLDSTQADKAERRLVDGEVLLREAEQLAGDQEVQLLDAKSLRRYVAAFERKYKENLEMRMKHAEQPEKFMESELDLDEEVQRLLVVAGSPELYPDFAASGAVASLVALLGHDNADIAADVIDLFQQLTDADAVEDSREEAAILVDSMLENNAIELLVHRLTSLAESTNDDEGKAVFNTLSIFENMVEVKPEVAEMVLDRSKLLKWMLARLRPREFDSNKQYTAELLAILLQSSAKNQQRVSDANGIDVLLQAIAPYKNRNPGSVDEEEYLENLFNSLCACLMSEETRGLFLRAEGVELMLLILKQKRVARAGALKALDFATTRSPANCERFVDQFGLKTIFAIFMGKAKMKRRRGEDAGAAEEEARALSVIANLFQGLARGSRRDRLAAKFVEDESEKCDRLLELYLRYHARVRAAEAEMGASEGEVDEEERLLARMEEGLYSLQQCALIVGHLWFVGDMGIRKRILQLLHQKSVALANVRDTLEEFLSSIGDDGSAAEAARERQRVKRMLAALGQEQTEEEAATATSDRAQDAGAPQPTGNGVASTSVAGSGAGELGTAQPITSIDRDGNSLGDKPPPLPPPEDGQDSADADGNSERTKAADAEAPSGGNAETSKRASAPQPDIALADGGKRHATDDRRRHSEDERRLERRRKDDGGGSGDEPRRHRDDRERDARRRDSRDDRDRDRHRDERREKRGREDDERRERKRERR